MRRLLMTMLSLLLAVFESHAEDYLVSLLQKKDGLSDNSVQCLCVDEGNMIFIGTRSGLDIYDGASFRPVSGSDFSISALYCDGEKVYVGAENGLYIYDSGSESLERVGVTTQWGVDIYCQVNCICRCGDNIVAGTHGQGFFVMDLATGRLRQYSTGMSYVTDVASINDNSFAVASSDKGVFHVNVADMSMTMVSNRRDVSQMLFSSGTLWTVVKDSAGESCLCRCDGAELRCVMDRVIAVSGYDDEYLMVTCPDALRLISRDGRTVQVWHCCADTEPVGDFARAHPARDREGNVWTATRFSGVVKIPSRKISIQRGRHQEKTTDPCMCVDMEGNTYRTVNKYVFRYDAYGNATGVCVMDMITYVLYCDKDGTIWTGTRMNGLCRDFVQVRMEPADMQPSSVYAVKADSYGYLWIACNLGIVRVNPSDMSMQVIAGTEILPQAEIFLPDSSPMESDGSLRFITENYTLKLYPSDYAGRRSVPQALVSHVVLRNSSRTIWNPGAGEVHIPYRDNSFTIYFSLPSYSRPQDNRYSCMLSGMDKTMSAWSRQTSVSYNGLAPGRYRFILKGMDGDGVESAAARTCDIIVDPLWWNSRTAIACYFLLAIAFAFLGVQLVRVSMRRKYNRRLAKAREKMETDSYKQRMSFFLGMVHEIRTPMTMMRLSLDRLSPSEPGDRKAVKVIGDNLSYINETIDGILNYQNNESAGAKLLLVRTDLAALCKEVAGKASDMARLKNLRLQCEVPETPVYVKADGIFFSKILTNLLSNALKYAGSAITMLLSVEGENAVIRVNDDGPGVDPAEKDRIFGMFYKADGDRVAEASGMGVGLAYARQLAVEHNAVIGQENLPGGGASFIVTIPLMTVAPAENSEKENLQTSVHDDIQPGGNIILVVEDNASLRAMLEEELSEWYDVRTASNGEEALSVLDGTGVDVIISDVMMPVMDGLELCRAVKEKREYSHIPFVMLTAKVSVHAKAEGLGCGADAYVEKPFSISQIRAQIDNLLKLREACRSLVLSGAGNSASSRENYVNRLDREFLDKVDALIESQMKEESFSIDALAESMCMSKSNFYRKFHAVTGSSPAEYLRNFRLNRAARMIMEGAKINEAAVSVGFYSSSYFAKCFSAKFGVLPKDYMNKN